MKALCLLALCAVALLPFSPTEAQEGVDTANRASQGLEAVGELLQYLAQPAADTAPRYVAAVTFVKNLMKYFAPSPKVAENLNKALDRSVDLEKMRSGILAEMRDTAAAIDGGVPPEREAELREQMRKCMGKLHELIIENFVVALGGAGIPEADARRILETDRMAYRLAPLIEARTAQEFAPYL